MSSELESDVCYRVYGIRLTPSGESYEGSLAESNGSLPPDEWLKVTCRLTACTPGSAPGPTLGNQYEKTLSFFSARCNIYISRLCYDVSVRLPARLSVCDGSVLAHYS